MRLWLLFVVCVLAGFSVRVAFTMGAALWLTGDHMTAVLIGCGPALFAAALLIPAHPDMET